MSTDIQVLSSLHASLSAGRQSNRPAGTSVLLQRLNRVLDSRPLNGDFYKTVGIKRLLGLHDLNPAFNGLLDVLNRLFVGLSLRKTAWKGRDFSDIIACLVFLYFHM